MRGRGRGRGGRGRGGRGRGGARGGRRGPYARAPRKDVEEKDEELELDIDENGKEFFIKTASFEQHHDAQEKNCMKYLATMKVLDKHNVDLAANARIRALAASFARKDTRLVHKFLEDKEKFGLVEVLKAITLLDSSRQIRVHEKKLKRLQMAGKVKKTKVGKIKSDINNLNKIKPKVGSASGAVCRHIRHWARQFTTEELEFYALHYPVENWRKLADICHFNPKTDFKNLPWFLPYCYGGEAPQDSMQHRCKDVTEENVNALLKEFDVPFSHVKPLIQHITNDSKARMAQYEKLDSVIWNYEDLQCTETDQVIQGRLDAGEKVTLNYGKLMERLLTMKIMREGLNRPYNSTPGDKNKAPFLKHLLPLAEGMLEEIRLPLETPIVVIGDRSASMDVAIQTSTIIASLLTAITKAKLVFFNTKNKDADFNPKTISDVLDMAVKITASGATAPAASLWPFYEKKEVVKTFVIATDEEENTGFKDHSFVNLYEKYYNEVYKAKLVFVSFLSQHTEGQMVKQLQKKGFGDQIIQYVFDSSRPDLSKLDSLFGLLSSESVTFEQEVKTMTDKLNEDSTWEMVDALTL